MPNLVLILFFVFLSCVIIVEMQMMPDYSDDYARPPADYPGGPGDDYPDRPDPRSMRGRGRGRGRYPDYGRGGPARKNEVVAQKKWFKLYEKKRLGFEKAVKFCKKKQGQLIDAQQSKKMRKLEALFMRARMTTNNIWVRASKRKKQAKREIDGGAEEPEMCPGIILGTKGMTSLQCEMPLPFICVYDVNRARTTRKPKKRGNSGAEHAGEEIMAEDDDNWREKFGGKDEI